MRDFDRQWNAAEARIASARRWTTFVTCVIFAMQITAAAGAIWLAVTIVRAGPAAIGSAFGQAVAAFDQARAVR